MNKKHINKSPLTCGGGLGVGIIPQGYKQTSIGIIPQDWEVVRLGEVCLVQSGGTPPKNKKSYWENGTIKWLGSSVCKNLHYVDEITDYITQKGLDNSSAKIFKQGTTLIALVGATIGKIAYLNFDASTNQNIAGIYPQNEKVLNRIFLFYISLMLYEEFEKLSSDKFKMANLSFIKSLQIPLPPLKEQEKIARILGVWDSALDTLANLIKAKRKYKTALMQRLLTPPKDIDCDTKSQITPSLAEGARGWVNPRNDDKHCHTTSPCHTDSPLCHTEGVARSIQKENLQGNAVCLDSSVATLPQNDKEISPQNDKENPRNDKFMDCHENPYGFAGFASDSRNDNSPPRNTTSPCHTNSPLCHTERSEVSKSKGVDFVDTSAFSKPQYDKILDSCNASPPCHCEEALATKQSANEFLRFAGFSDKWQEFRLGDIGQIYQPQTIPQSDFAEIGYNVYGANGIIGKYHSYNHEKAQIAIACRGNSCGVVNFTSPKSWITGNAMVINLDNSKVADKTFAYYALLNSNLNYLITGSGQPQITGNIKNHKIKLPTLAEQKKIAQVLSVCDKEIETLNLKFECLKEQKKGLMQQFLSGKVRVKC